MHLTGNVQEGSTVICNCCVCCCKALKGLTQLHNPRSVMRSNFAPEIDPEKCTLCLKCKKTCPMAAISKLPGLNADGSDSKMIIQDTSCLGCGLCHSHCPENAITMVKVRDHIPAENLKEMNERYLREKIW
jgi:Pyruvate/2-oxoacid:ferredoxin oxidoreductase delta subunit